MLNNLKYKIYILWLIPLIPLLIMLQGCAQPISSDIATGSIYTSMSLTCMDNGTTDIEVSLSASNASGADIYLLAGDMLEANADNQTYPLIKEEDWPNIIRYLTTIDTNDPGAQVTIDFNRSSYTPATGSQIILPEQSEILSPLTSDMFTLNDQLDVSWNPGTYANQTTAIEFDITCQDDQGTSGDVLNFDVMDNGLESFSVQDLMDGWNLGQNPTCEATISLIRSTTGTISSEFRSGKITAVRTTSVVIQIEP